MKDYREDLLWCLIITLNTIFIGIMSLVSGNYMLEFTSLFISAGLIGYSIRRIYLNKTKSSS